MNLPDQNARPVRPTRAPTHPGEILKEDVIPALGLSVAQAARDLGVSRPSLYAVLNGRAAMTPDMAVRVGKWTGNGPDLWLRMQMAHDLWHAQQRLVDAVERIPTREAKAA